MQGTVPRESRESMICGSCGHEITSNSSSFLCPTCGTVIRKHPKGQSLGSYIQASQNYAGEQSTPLPGEFSTSQTTSKPHAQFSGDESEYIVRSFHATNTINVPATAGFASARSYDSALAVEFILSLLGIFGIGWLLAGETVIGFLLLACSILIYWPMMILGTLVTLGFGLMCLGPLAVSCVICNALLLNLCLKRKTARRR
jgi:predicted RNA-binding Zn-ribbon protein involved in translation (DUF1610 family)